MPMLKKDFEAFIGRYGFLIGKEYDITFDVHTTTAKLTAIEPQKSTGFVLAPDKRMVNGKLKTPEMITFVFNNFRAVFIVEDMDIVCDGDGLGFKISMGSITFSAREVGKQ